MTHLDDAKQAPAEHGNAVKTRERVEVGPGGLTEGPRIAVRRIKAFMDLFGVSVTEMAKAAGVDRSYVSKLLAGQVRATPRLLTATCSAIEALARQKRVDTQGLIEL